MKLEYKPYVPISESAQGRSIQFIHIATLESHHAFSGRLKSAHDIEQRGFAHAGGPGNGEALPGMDHKIDPLQDLYEVSTMGK
jgi:hypothetical protein